MQDGIQEIHELLAFRLGSNHEQRSFKNVGTGDTGINRHRLQIGFILWSEYLLICSLPGFSFQIVHLNSGLINVAYRMLIHQQREQLPCSLRSLFIMQLLFSNKGLPVAIGFEVVYSISLVVFPQGDRIDMDVVFQPQIVHSLLK